MGCSFLAAISITASNNRGLSSRSRQTLDKPNDFQSLATSATTVILLTLLICEYESDYIMPRQLPMLVLLLFVACVGTLGTAQDYKGHKYQGTIDSVDTSKLVLREPDAETIEFLIAPQAKIMRDNRPAPLADLQRDDVAIITAERDGNLLVALSIFVVEPE